MALYPNLFNYLLVEVVEKFFTGVTLPCRYFNFKLSLKLVKLELNLFRSAALLIDGGNTLLEINTGFHGSQHFVTGAEYPIEEAELLVEQFIDPFVGCVVLIDEVDHHHIESLTVTMTATDALFNALGIPGQVKIDDQIAELKINAFGSGFGGNQN